MRVLGGCKKCIWYKETLLCHASKCQLPLGACVVEKCDNIREYIKKNRVPGNRKWKYQHDELFFRRSPPSTPTLPKHRSSSRDQTDQQFMAQLVQAACAFSSRPEHHGDADNLNDDQCLISDGSSTSYTEESLRVSSGAWNLYHVDRPPDLLVTMDRLSDGPQERTQERADVQVTRGPAVDNQVRLERQAGDVETESAAVTAAAAAPISAACMPDASQQLLQEEQGEIIWPLNKVILTCEFHSGLVISSYVTEKPL